MFFSQITTFLALILAVLYITQASQTLSPKNRGSKKKPEEKTEKKVQITTVGPQNYSVLDKNLAVANVVARDILQNYQAFFTETDEYNFEAMVLGYVTPWNNHGYDIAKIFGNKFTHISPVWLQIKRRGMKSYQVTGIHDIDKQWIIDVRNAGRQRKTKVVPRVLFDGWSGGDYSAILKDVEELQSMVRVLVNSCKQYRFDGYVLEMWSQIAGSVVSEVMVGLVQAISDTFLTENLIFILVIPPNHGKTKIFSEKEFDALYDHVTAFSLMTYDFSSPQETGPNAPLLWIEDCIKDVTNNKTRRPKILMGLNFYGNDFSPIKGTPIVGHEYIKILEKHKNLALTYNEEVAEHFFHYRDDIGSSHLVFYPTLKSILERLLLAHKLNVGISIWEIGQGLDYFYDLL